MRGGVEQYLNMTNSKPIKVFWRKLKRGSIFDSTKLTYGNDHYYSICTWLPRNYA